MKNCWFIDWSFTKENILDIDLIRKNCEAQNIPHDIVDLAMKRLECDESLCGYIIVITQDANVYGGCYREGLFLNGANSPTPE